MSRITTGEIPVTRESLQPIRRLRGGATSGAILCRLLDHHHQRSGSLCVIKVLKDKYGGGSDVRPAPPPAEFLLYTEEGKLPQHERIVECIGAFNHYPQKGLWTLILPWYNAGSVGDLTDESELRGKSVPEVVIWHVISGVLEGLKVLADAGMAHKDLHVGNIMLHFDDPIGEDSLPKVRLIDLGDQMHGTDHENSLKGDLYSFFEGINYLITCPDFAGGPPKQQYSVTLRKWIALLTGQFPDGSPIPSFETVFRDLHPHIAGYIKELGVKGRPTKLCGWMISYFQRIQQKANNVTVPKRKSGEPVEILDLVECDDEDSEDEKDHDSKAGSRSSSTCARETQTTQNEVVHYPNLPSPKQQPWIVDGRASIHSSVVQPTPFFVYDGLGRIVGHQDHSGFSAEKREVAPARPVFGRPPSLDLGLGVNGQQCHDLGLRNPAINELLIQGPPLFYSNQAVPITLDTKAKTYKMVPALESFFSMTCILDVKADPLDLEDIRQQFCKRLEKIRDRAEADLAKILRARIAGHIKIVPSYHIFWLADVSRDCYRRVEELMDNSAQNSNEVANVKKRWEAQIGVVARNHIA